MTITTEDALRMAGGCDIDNFPIRAAAIRSLAAERDALRAEIEKLRAENAKLAASNHAYLSDYQEARGEIEKLRAALQTARRDALEEAARWHDEQEKFWMEKGREVSALDSQSGLNLLAKAAEHRKHAAAIRALKGKGDD